jgi:hypothetical protein
MSGIEIMSIREIAMLSAFIVIISRFVFYDALQWGTGLLFRGIQLKIVYGFVCISIILVFICFNWMFGALYVGFAVMDLSYRALSHRIPKEWHKKIYNY